MFEKLFGKGNSVTDTLFDSIKSLLGVIEKMSKSQDDTVRCLSILASEHDVLVAQHQEVVNQLLAQQTINTELYTHIVTLTQAMQGRKSASFPEIDFDINGKKAQGSGTN